MPTILGYRTNIAESTRQERILGEWDGPRKWDDGRPPEFLPDLGIQGTEDCISNGESNLNPPRPPEGPTYREVCLDGRRIMVPERILVSFWHRYGTNPVTFFNDIPLSLRVTDCEARWEGYVRALDAYPTVRLRAVEDDPHFTYFYLGQPDRSPPDLTTECPKCPGGTRPIWYFNAEGFASLHGDLTLDRLNGKYAMVRGANYDVNFGIGAPDLESSPCLWVYEDDEIQILYEKYAGGEAVSLTSISRQWVLGYHRDGLHCTGDHDLDHNPFGDDETHPDNVKPPTVSITES